MGKKKDREKLARVAELEAEIERRERKAAKKALAKSDALLAADAKKAKGKKKSKPASKKIDRSKVKKAKAVDVGPIGVTDEIVITAEAEAHIEPIADVTVAERAKVISDPDELNAALTADTDAALKRRVQAKRAIRLGLPDPDTIDRADELAVRAYNKEAVKVGAALLTSDAEREKVAKRKAPKVEPVRLSEPKDPPVERVVESGPFMGAVVTMLPEQTAEIVETEHGREIVVGESVAASPEYDFAKPSEAPKADFDVNGNGQYLVERPSDKKLVGYTRVTSYIAGIEDRSGIEKWKLRVLLEGVAAAEETGDAATARVRDLMHARDVAIAKARKADRKGKLATGELATYVEGAWRDFKKAIDALADELFEIGGGREKASKGTDLHALFELHDTEGMQAVADLATLGQITPADLADVEAYAELVASWGIRFVDVERVVVNDAVPAPTASNPGRVIGVAGRLDRTGYVKLPGEARARKRVVDVKTGSLEYSAGEIARQLASYAASKGYDLDTHEREDLKLDQKTAIVIHLPAGSAKATLHAVDLAKGRKGLKIIGEMRAFRNEGKTALTLVEHEQTVD